MVKIGARNSFEIEIKRRIRSGEVKKHAKFECKESILKQNQAAIDVEIDQTSASANDNILVKAYFVYGRLVAKVPEGTLVVQGLLLDLS